MVCPRCGKGRLYQGMLQVADECSECGLPLTANDSGDGAAYFVIVVVGVLVGGFMLWTELTWEPPVWMHLVLWLPLILLLSIAGLRFTKALLIALQYKHRAEDFNTNS